MTVKLSVIMGVYNGARHVRRAIVSIVKQTFPDWEFIICDDGSTDETWDCLQSYARDPRFRLLKNENNLGLAATLNRCIQEARAEILVRQDADDYSVAERLALQYKAFLDLAPVSVLGCYAGLYRQEETRIWGVSLYPSIPRLADWAKKSQVVHASVFMKKADVLKVGGYDPGALRVEDYDLWLRMLAEKNMIIKTYPQVLYHAQYKPGDNSRRKTKDRLREIRMCARHFRRLKMPWRLYGYLCKHLIAILLPAGLFRRFHHFRFRIRERNPGAGR